ncbi:MAG TPA: glycosyltransferase family 2 protein [Vicinamibacterales bacterium]|jgi:glycosyltransferase involved in cell wall biosynthesis|nr:glycosyltransferase family 2 protein [Vicinamibacterales bacterium]
MPAPAGPRPSISAFFPCYNDESTIAGLVREADAQLRCATDDYEIIVVNDGSGDGSAAVLAALAREMPRLTVVTHDVNRGYGGALRSGFAAAKKDLVFYTDGDGQYDVREIPIMLALLVDDTDFVNGMKMARSDPAYRVFVGNLHKFVTRWAFWLPIDDVDCDYRLIRRSVLDRLELHSNSGSICVELVKNAQRAGARFRQVSVRHYSRQFGSSQFFRPGRILRTYADLALMWLRLMVLRRGSPADRIRA